MKTKSLQVTLLLFGAWALFSCRKEKMSANTNTELLTQRSWHYHSFGVDTDLDGDIDNPTNLQDCQKDDIIRFASDGTGTLDQNLNLCYPDFPKTENFTWQFLNNETQLEYGGAVHTILTLDESRLAIYTEEDSGSGPVRYILIFH